MFSVSVVIPTYNGRDLLLKNLPHVFAALERADVSAEVIVVDDAGSDDSMQMLAAQFPTVIALRNERNLGFAETMNRGILAAHNDILLALNNDVTVEPDLLEKLLPRFRDENLFAVTPQVLDPTSKRQQAIYKLRPGICWFRDTCLPEPPVADETLLFFASGGSSCFDRKKLVDLGGFSPLYAPFYVEDVDLSYQAWKRGWKCVLEPATTVWHPVNTTIRKYHQKRKIKFLTARNKHIFLWLNITDTWLVYRYFICLLPSLLWDLLSFRKYKLVGMFMALKRLPLVIEARRQRKLHNVIADKKIMELVSYRN